MDRSVEKFDFQATVRSVGEAVVSVICHILFDFALVGIGVAIVLAICAVVLKGRKHHFARPFFVVSRRIATACAVLAVPGCGFLLATGHLPESGVYLNFSFGFLVLWSMVTIYLCAEEMNFEWFTRGEKSPQVIEDETAVVSSLAPATTKFRKPNPSTGDVTLKLEKDDPAGGDVTLKIAREQDTAGDVTLKIAREQEVPGDVTVKLDRNQRASADSNLKNESAHDGADGDVTVKIERQKDASPGEVGGKSEKEQTTEDGEVTVKIARKDATQLV